MPPNILDAIYHRRRMHLQQLVDERGALAIAGALGYSSGSFISQMLGPRARRRITEGTARRIEAALGLEAGWLDREVQLSLPL